MLFCVNSFTICIIKMGGLFIGAAKHSRIETAQADQDALFFDNIFTDMKVQTRIREMQDLVVRTAREMEEIPGKLHQMILY